MKKFILILFLLLSFKLVYSQTTAETFTKFIYGTNAIPSLNDTSLYLNNCMQMNGWSGKRVYSAGGAAYVKAGYLITPVLNLTTNTTITFISWTNHSADQLIIDMTNDNGLTWINATNVSVNGTKTTYTKYNWWNNNFKNESVI